MIIDKIDRCNMVTDKKRNNEFFIKQWHFLGIDYRKILRVLLGLEDASQLKKLV